MSTVIIVNSKLTKSRSNIVSFNDWKSVILSHGEGSEVPEISLNQGGSFLW